MRYAEIAGYFFYMAETFYFSHDFGARNDPKLISLQMELGHEGKGIFWDLIEILYEQDGYILESELKSIAFALHTKYERITDVLTKYDLFVNEDGKYWSESVLRRLELRYSKSEKARNSVNERWKRLRKDTNVLPTKYEGNTIKESKGEKEKENKVKDIYKSKREFYEKEISENSDKEQIEGYKNMVKYIFGENPIKVPLDKILKATHQLSYESFVELVEIQSKSTKKLRDILLEMNGHKNQYTILFAALKKWMQ